MKSDNDTLNPVLDELTLDPSKYIPKTSKTIAILPCVKSDESGELTEREKTEYRYEINKRVAKWKSQKEDSYREDLEQIYNSNTLKDQMNFDSNF